MGDFCLRHGRGCFGRVKQRAPVARTTLCMPYNIFKKAFIAGIVTISLPFGSLTITTSGVGFNAVPTTNPTAVNSSVGSNTSFNWGGYEAINGTYTSISGTWTIPTVPSATSTEADATWIGIGGVKSKDLIQAGTQAVINGSGAPVYQAWYETLPQATTQVPLTVSPGDSMSATLTQTSAASGATPAEWSVTIRDNTTGQSYQTSIAYNSSLSSAEWIEEMPSDGSSFVPLDNFGTASFSNGMTTVNGNLETIAGANAQELTMVNSGGQTLAATSALGADGESFTVTRTTAAVASGIGSASGGYYVITRGAGVGRGWRRTGVGVEGYSPRTQPTSTSVGIGSGAGIGTGGFTPGNAAWQRFYQIIQQFQSLRSSYLRR